MKFEISASVIAGILNAILSFVITKPAQLLVGLGKAFVFGAIITLAAIYLANLFGKKNGR